MWAIAGEVLQKLRIPLREMKPIFLCITIRLFGEAFSGCKTSISNSWNAFEDSQSIRIACRLPLNFLGPTSFWKHCSFWRTAEYFQLERGDLWPLAGEPLPWEESDHKVGGEASSGCCTFYSTEAWSWWSDRKHGQSLFLCLGQFQKSAAENAISASRLDRKC